MSDVVTAEVKAFPLEQMPGTGAAETSAGTPAIMAAVLEVLCSKLAKTSGLVAENTEDLSRRFRELAVNADAQSTKVKEIVAHSGNLVLDGEEMSVDDFARCLTDTIGQEIDKILFVSKTAMQMVYKMDEALQSLGHVENIVTRVQGITKQSNLLALNATIEATRAGDQGKGFAVVAHEVRKISSEVAELSQDIKGNIGNVTDVMHQTFQLMQAVATTDLKGSIVSSEKIDAFMRAFLEKNREFTHILEEAAAHSDHTSSAIGKVIVDMQFQDRNAQFIENSINLLQVTAERLRNLQAQEADASGDAGEDSAFADALLECIRLGEFKQALVEQLSLVAGLAPHLEQYREDTAGGEGEGMPADTDDDDIELF